MHEPYPPVLPLPEGLSDEAAAQLLEYLYEFARVFENYYADQLHRYHARPDDIQLDLWRDPPF